MIAFLFWLAIGFMAGVVFSSFFEWTLHRFFMHKPWKSFRYPFEKHTLVHHHIFKADDTYHLINEKDKKTIPMAWWNGPVIVALCQLPFLIWAFFAHKWGVLCGAAVACTLYFSRLTNTCTGACICTEENVHVDALGNFLHRLNGHHLLHHRYMHKNFNVVLPVADLIMGTLRLHAEVCLRTATHGPSVPSVQPKIRKLKQTHPAA